MNQTQKNRDFMKCPNVLGEGVKKSDQQLGLPHPPHSKSTTGELITLKTFQGGNIPLVNDSYETLLESRRSIRSYDENAFMSQEQLSFLLYSIQGIQSYRGNNNIATLRTVPSGGARHPFEVYIVVHNVEGLQRGIYRYVPLENIGQKIVTIELLKESADVNKTVDMVSGQKWVGGASVVLFISCVPYKTEWRYVEHSYRLMLIDLGHLGQNTMLSAAALGLGSCCLASYNQLMCDQTLGLDGTDEYTVYGIAVGKNKQ